jgi:hypothetical protein
MALAMIPFRLVTPASRPAGFVNMGLEQLQQSQDDQLELKRQQDWLLSPGAACLHIQALLIVTNGIFLVEMCGEHLEHLGYRQIHERGDQEPGLFVAGHLHDKDLHRDMGPLTAHWHRSRLYRKERTRPYTQASARARSEIRKRMPLHASATPRLMWLKWIMLPSRRPGTPGKSNTTSRSELLDPRPGRPLH